ncbi:coiled-coil domain-containing protein 125 isoform X2 [Acanthopagrus latus]|uniref:coiled-coil domain-containing protein 125 isoform X2 n=1 Tax=Acanthopagrus latus TaxID=8177 RepID=UPI00187D071A|nr:coiled-coil domain-containing protein 125 isoform X2 [Acanthopagrus latus]
MCSRVPMQVSEACRPDDDMADGDLGDGMGLRSAPSSTRKKNQSLAGSTEIQMPGAERRRCGSQTGEAAWIPGLMIAETQQRAFKKLSHFDPLVELSKEELKDRLREATELIDVLGCELEVAHRYFEGKYEALRILQGKAILDKATGHTKSLLQKSEEKARALEKEVNSLQWELSFNQIQMKRSQQSWEQKYNRILNENKTLTDNLERNESQIQQLRAENSALSRQCMELLSMLDVKEQRAYQGTKPQFSPERDASVLELAVLGACRCLGVAEACPCSRTAAASRKQLIQLQQELDAQCSRREEALMVADAFRIAFEQQLRKRSEHFLLLAEANTVKFHHYKGEDVSRSVSLSQKLRGLLPSSLEVKMPDDLLETLYRLLDLLNDKEEALAHQRKVSIMLAHSAEKLQRKLHLDSHCQPSDPSQSRTPSKQPQPHPPSENQRQSQRQSDTSEIPELPDSQLQPGKPHCPGNNLINSEPQEPEPSQTNIKSMSNQGHKSA